MPKGTPKQKINKSAWIRNQPTALTAKELVENAKKENIALTVQQVYMVRHNAKTKAVDAGGVVAASAAAAAAPAATKGKPGPKPKLKNGASRNIQNAGTSTSASSVRQDFVRLATRLGTDEMRRLIDQLDLA